MKLTHEQIKSITLGASYVELIDEKTVFHRFTKKQENLYKEVSDNFYNKTSATSCIRLEFETDSASLFIKTEVKPRSSRTYYSHDLFVDGAFYDALSGRLDTKERDVISKHFDLGKSGTSKTVCMHLPWSCSSDIIEISVDNGSSVIPTKKSRKMLCFGDSITQGYDAVYASNSYASKLTTAFDAETRNKGIGGEIFRPELAKIKDGDFEPDIITVAYGTNDWYTDVPKDVLIGRINDFFDALAQNYPDAKIFAISPIWRADWKDEHTFGDFLSLKEELSAASDKYSNVTLIDGFDFIPQDRDLFSDKYLHPNDDGFSYYAKKLIYELEKYI